MREIVSGIYFIRNNENDMIYIGSSNNLYRRLCSHKWALNSNKHANSYLQNAFNKYGKNAFTYEIVEVCDISELIEKEQSYLDKYDCSKKYNSRIIAESTLGVRHSEEMNRNKSRITKESWLNPLIRERRINGLKGNRSIKGQKRPKEVCEKISASLIGNKRTLGYKLPEEKRKIKSEIAKKKGISLELREKINTGLRQYHKNRLEKLRLERDYNNRELEQRDRELDQRDEEMKLKKEIEIIKARSKPKSK